MNEDDACFEDIAIGKKGFGNPDEIQKERTKNRASATRNMAYRRLIESVLNGGLIQFYENCRLLGLIVKLNTKLLKQKAKIAVNSLLGVLRIGKILNNYVY